MRKRAFFLRNRVLGFLKTESVCEMADRIAENYGILIAATEMVIPEDNAFIHSLNKLKEKKDGTLYFSN